MAHHRKTLEFAMLVKKRCDITSCKKRARNRSWQKTLKERNMVQKKRIVNVEDKTQSKPKKKKGQVKTQVPRGKKRDATFPANPDQPLICTVTGKKGGGNSHVTHVIRKRRGKRKKRIKIRVIQILRRSSAGGMLTGIVRDVTSTGK